MSDPQRFKVREPDVIHDTIEGEVILLNLETGTYYQVQGTGVEVWDAIAAGNSVGEITSQMVTRFDSFASDIQTGIQAFVQNLLDENLIVPAERPAPTSSVTPSNGSPKTAFVAPTLLKYTDMQSLLLLDPVHDVDEQGWPTLKSPNPSA